MSLTWCCFSMSFDCVDCNTVCTLTVRCVLLGPYSLADLPNVALLHFPRKGGLGQLRGEEAERHCEAWRVAPPSGTSGAPVMPPSGEGPHSKIWKNSSCGPQMPEDRGGKVLKPGFGSCQRPWDQTRPRQNSTRTCQTQTWLETKTEKILVIHIYGDICVLLWYFYHCWWTIG